MANSVYLTFSILVISITISFLLLALFSGAFVLWVKQALKRESVVNFNKRELARYEPVLTFLLRASTGLKVGVIEDLINTELSKGHVIFRINRNVVTFNEFLFPAERPKSPHVESDPYVVAMDAYDYEKLSKGSVVALNGNELRGALLRIIDSALEADRTIQFTVSRYVISIQVTVGSATLYDYAVKVNEPVKSFINVASIVPTEGK